MTSPLDLPPEAAHQATRHAKAKFLRARADARLARQGSLALVLAASLIVAVNGIDWIALLVIGGAATLTVLTKRRADTLERRLWWHQARSGLVNALAERSGTPVIIDLRDEADEPSHH